MLNLFPKEIINIILSYCNGYIIKDNIICRIDKNIINTFDNLFKNINKKKRIYIKNSNLTDKKIYLKLFKYNLRLAYKFDVSTKYYIVEYNNFSKLYITISIQEEIDDDRCFYVDKQIMF